MIGKLALLRIATVAVLGGVALAQGRSDRLRAWRAAEVLLAVYAASQLLFLLFLWRNHVPFPLHLEIMEGTVWDAARRASAGLAVYPWPTPAYVPLAYNPLFYYLGVPALHILGDGVPALRLVAVVGMAASLAGVGVAVGRLTGSRWWAFIAMGLFAGAYKAMDSYLDTAHADSWLLACGLWGTILVGRARTVREAAPGILVLVLGFWFKQHGAVLAAGGLTWLTWRFGWRRSLPLWGIAAVAGPAVYVLAGNALFGPAFHFFTWTVPGHWSDPSLGGVARVAVYLLKWYSVLVLAAAFLVVKGVRNWTARDEAGLWRLQFVFAVGTALMGALDRDSSNNVFIPAGAWCIVLGTAALGALGASRAATSRWRLDLLALAVAVASLIYDPRTVLTGRNAAAEYADLIGYIRSLPGTVYAPSQGYLGPDVSLTPGAHWVPLQDMLRGPRATAADTAAAHALLQPALHPAAPAWVLYGGALSRAQAPLRDLAAEYSLDQDFGARFAALTPLDHRWSISAPRFLYRYQPPVSVTPPPLAGRRSVPRGR